MNFTALNKHKYLLLFLLCLLFVVPDCFGQYFKKIGMNDGLSNLSVLSIYQDTLGRMWFGTNEGVNVYDGRKIDIIKSYETDNGRRKSCYRVLFFRLSVIVKAMFSFVTTAPLLNMIFVKKRLRKSIRIAWGPLTA